MAWYEKLTGDLADKKRYREYKARVKVLPEAYRTAVEGIDRYLMYTGPGDGTHLIQMLVDLADLFERAAVDGTPVADIVGTDPVAFADEFKSNYGTGSWLTKEQKRLTDAIAEAEKHQS
jgi:DNA-binding ferritin-like protein (Dps family)